MQDQPTTNALLGSSIAPETKDVPRIYVACLAAYNSGILHGRWIDAESENQIWEEVKAMLSESPEPSAEEWAIHDYDGFEGLEISEYQSFEMVVSFAEIITGHGKLGAELVNHFSQDLAEVRTALDNYAGEYKSVVEFAQELTEQTAEQIPENIAPYIDYEAMGRDLELGGDVFTIELGFEETHIFWSR